MFDQELLKRGYRVQYRRGEVVYCRAEAITGSRLTSTLCRSAQQIKEDEQRAREVLGPAGVQRASGCPAGMSCN